MSDQYVWRLALTSKTPQSTKPDGNQIATTGANWIANTWTSNTRNDFIYNIYVYRPDTYVYIYMIIHVYTDISIYVSVVCRYLDLFITMSTQKG